MGCVGCLMLHSHELSACLSRFLGLQLIADYRATSTEGACGCLLLDRNSQDVSCLALKCQAESTEYVRPLVLEVSPCSVPAHMKQLESSQLLSPLLHSPYLPGQPSSAGAECCMSESR